MKKKIIITLNDEESDFELEMPDGEVNLEYLIDTLQIIIHDLSHIHDEEDFQEPEEVTPTEVPTRKVSKKDLN